jgi:hypothetical protein
VIQLTNVSILRNTGHSSEATPPTGMAELLSLSSRAERLLHSDSCR